MLDQVVEVTTEAHQRDDLEIDVNDQNNEDGLQNGDGRDESDGHATESKKQQASAEVDFPKAVLKRIVKEKMREFFERNDMQTEMESSVDIQISKDALTAFNEAAKLFVYYITATANDICRESKRQTISPKDVITALQEVEFEELVEPVASLVEALKQTRETKKRKAEALNVHEEIKNKIEEETETAIKDKDDCMEEHVEQQMEGKDS